MVRSVAKNLARFGGIALVESVSANEWARLEFSSLLT